MGKIEEILVEAEVEMRGAYTELGRAKNSSKSNEIQEHYLIANQHALQAIYYQNQAIIKLLQKNNSK